MSVLAASKFGVKPNASGTANSAALTRAFSTIDDGTIVTFRPETYQLSDPVRILRGNVAAQGVTGTAFEYTSHTDGTTDVGQAWLIGSIGTVGDPQPANITLSNFTMRDLNRVDMPYQGHLPSPIEVYWVENFTLDGITFDGSRGNGAFLLIGQAQNDLTALTKRATIQRCRIIGDHQGDGFNTGGVQHIDFLNNEMPFGGVRRHFYEGGAATSSVTMRGNRVNMNNQGIACWGSMTLIDSADVSDNWFLNWTNAGGALCICPDVDPTGKEVMPVRGLTARGNVFSSRAGLAAVQIDVPDVYDHEYTGNLFDCMLPVYVAVQPKGTVTIRGNTARSDCTRPIAAAVGVLLDTDWPVAA